MKSDYLARQALDRRFNALQPTDWTRPSRGWLRAIRDALGMTTAQLARRLHVSQPRILALEKNEVRGAITLETLERAARALDCQLVYTLVPNRPLEKLIHERAEHVATRQLATTNHSMQLENQGLSDTQLRAQHEELVKELIQGNTRRLWDESP